MENRKELSEKSKKLIAMQFKSDILNKSTGYYKKEKIFPITAKPNELKIKLEKFVPHFNEVNPAERRFNNLLSDKQRNNSFIIKHKKLAPNKNPELELIRKRAKTIKQSCYDEKGNFSSKRRYIFEFFGIEKLNEINNEQKINDNDKNNNNTIKNIKTVKENEEEKNKTGEEKENVKENKNYDNFKKLKSNRRKRMREMILKSRNINNNYNNNINKNKEYYSYINPENDRFNTVNDEKENLLTYNDFNEENKSIPSFNNYEDKYINKISRNRNKIDNQFNINLSTMTNKQMQNTVTNIGNPFKIHNRIKTDIHFPSMFSYNSKIIPKYHAKDISKLFYTKTNFPTSNLRIKKNERKNDEKEYFNLEFKFSDKNLEENPSINDNNLKNIKEIFYKNGLHLYDLNEDGMNMLTREKKMAAKLRKSKDDINFEKNYKKVVDILEKSKINVDKTQISNEKGFQINAVKKKRRATPGTVLYDNRFHKDENTKINTGNKNKKIVKKNKNNLIQINNNYKNHHKFKENYFNHKKK